MAFLVREKQNKKGWRIVEEKYIPKKIVTTVPLRAYAELGFRPDMTLSEAKTRAKQINQQHQFNSRKVVNIANRIEHQKNTASLFLPTHLVEQFEAELKELYLDNEYRFEITLRYWRAAQLVILNLAVDSKDFKNEGPRFLNYCKKKLWSHDYIKRITRMLNLWGSFCAKKRGTFYNPIPKLNSLQVQRISDLRENVTHVRRPAEPLEWQTLRNAKDKFESEGLIQHWNWMFIATWF